MPPSDQPFADALPPRYQLHWYVLERVLGQGGFGITYLARDTNLDQAVAIKEYLPVDVATRRTDSTVRSRTEDQTERYRWGLDRFIREARTLARFDHPNIVRVHSVFEINNTAYMVMRFEEGENLAARLELRRTLPEAELRRIILPILDGLELVHGAGFIHRDIKPDNIHIREDGSPVLLDFGSARLAHGQSRTVTILVAPGYAPFEQYHSSGENQGPWSDIYSLGATAYRAISGMEPMDAVARSRGVLYSTGDPLVPASAIGANRYTPPFLAAIDHALAFAERDRPQSIAEWKQELAANDGPAAPPVRSATARAPAPPPVPAPAAPPARRSSDARFKKFAAPASWIVLGIVIALVVLKIFWPDKPPDGPNPPDVTPPKPVIVTPVPPPVAAAAPSDGERKRIEENEKARAEERAKREALEKKLAALEEQVREAADARRKAEAERRRDLEKSKLEAEKRRAAQAEAKRQETERQAALAAKQKTEEEAQKAALADRKRQEEAARLAALAEKRKQEEAAKAAEEAKKTAKKPDPGADQFAAAQKATERGNTAEAFVLLRESARLGNANAQFTLGEMYAAGRGVSRNEFQAYVWFSLAVLGGNDKATAGRDAAARALQPAERRQADDLVQDLRRAAGGR